MLNPTVTNSSSSTPLKAIFIGAKVEGESGFINEMKIKATYFEQGVFPQLMMDIDAACKPFDALIEARLRQLQAIGDRLRDHRLHRPLRG